MIEAHPDGVVVTVWVVPGASSDEVVGIHGGALKVRTVAPPEGGKANRSVARMVAAAVGGSRGRVVSGAGARRKGILVPGVTESSARSALESGTR